MTDYHHRDIKVRCANPSIKVFFKSDKYPDIKEFKAKIDTIALRMPAICGFSNFGKPVYKFWGTDKYADTFLVYFARYRKYKRSSPGVRMLIGIRNGKIIRKFCHEMPYE